VHQEHLQVQLTLALHHLVYHQEIVMQMAMETLNILYHQNIMHLTQKFSRIWIGYYYELYKWIR
jgi:hypothetical protein